MPLLLKRRSPRCRLGTAAFGEAAGTLGEATIVVLGPSSMHCSDWCWVSLMSFLSDPSISLSAPAGREKTHQVQEVNLPLRCLIGHQAIPCFMTLLCDQKHERHNAFPLGGTVRQRALPVNGTHASSVGSSSSMPSPPSEPSSAIPLLA